MNFERPSPEYVQQQIRILGWVLEMARECLTLAPGCYLLAQNTSVHHASPARDPGGKESTRCSRPSPAQEPPLRSCSDYAGRDAIEYSCFKLRPTLNLTVILGSLPNADRRRCNPGPNHGNQTLLEIPHEVFSLWFPSVPCRCAVRLWGRTRKTDKHYSCTLIGHGFEQSTRHGRFHRNRHLHRSH